MKSREDIERVRSEIVPKALLQARDKTWEAVRAIAEAIRPGLTETEATKIAKSVLTEMGAGKNWHRAYVRFGRNTLKCYGDPSEPDVVLGGNDIFYVDIGPAWVDAATDIEVEGDAGDTFTTGSDPEMKRCARDARGLFDAVKKEWERRDARGAELYDFAAAEAEKLGWRLNLKANGHRISEFPHALHFKGDLMDADFKPAPHLWVLEILIRHPEREFGAFYEDVLF